MPRALVRKFVKVSPVVGFTRLILEVSFKGCCVECCIGLDVHQETVVACVLFGPLEQKPKKAVQTFGTTTPELLAQADWLEEQKCSQWKVKEYIGSQFETYWRLVRFN